MCFKSLECRGVMTGVSSSSSSSEGDLVFGPAVLGSSGFSECSRVSRVERGGGYQLRHLDRR
jgi:hypothetical protein